MGDGWTGAWCAEHGEIDRVDEDGCCPSCGGSAVGEGAERALKLTSVLEGVNRAMKRRGMERDAARAAHEMFERKFIKAERTRIAVEAELAELRERVEVEALHARRHVITLRCSGRLDASHECERFSDMLRRLLEPEGGEHG